MSPAGDDVDPSALHDTMLELAAEVTAHFGDVAPTDEELRAFLKDRMVARGASESEAERLLGEI